MIALLSHIRLNWVRYLIAVGALALIAFLIWARIAAYGDERFEAGAQSVEDADNVARIERDKENAAQVQYWKDLNEQVTHDLYETKNTLAAARAARPAAVIRVCKRADDRGPVSAYPGSASGTHDGLSGKLLGASSADTQTDFDIAPLDRLHDEADLEHAECTKLKTWVHSIKR